MNRLFLPRTLRFHLSPRVRTLFLVVGILLTTLGGLLSVYTVKQRKDIDAIPLLSNKELLMLRVAGRKDPEKKEEYISKQSELSRRYVEERGRHNELFTGSLLMILAGTFILKVRKNLARK